MITINSRFKYEKYGENWIVWETIQGTNKKTKTPIIHYRPTYHANLLQASKYIVDQTAGDCEELNEIIKLLRNPIDFLKSK